MTAKTATRYEQVLILGVGTGAGRVLQALAATRPPAWIKLAAVDTDHAELDYLEGVLRIPMGREWTAGRGCGGEAWRGEMAMASALDDIRQMLNSVDLVILVGCLGGGTASGGLEVLHRLLQEEEQLSITVVSLPMENEGSERADSARNALESFRKLEGVVLSIPTDRIIGQLPPSTPFLDALAFINQLLADALFGFTRLIRTREGIPLDLSALRRLLAERVASCALANAVTEGDQALARIVDTALASPLLGGADQLQQAHVVIGALAGGPKLSLQDVSACIRQLRTRLQPSTRTLIATCPMPDIPAGRFQLTLLAIRYEPKAEPRLRSELDAFRFGDMTTRITVGGGSNLPATTNEIIGLLGIFSNATPTIHNGENLDMPTYLRRGISLQQILESVHEIYMEQHQPSRSE